MTCIGDLSYTVGLCVANVDVNDVEGGKWTFGDEGNTVVLSALTRLRMGRGRVAGEGCMTAMGTN